ncbi:MAG: hypothetical protein HQK53_14415 [Oligoflexia bacterium]|nr:hypothetical protein [Oligoflexia bacterium]
MNFIIFIKKTILCLQSLFLFCTFVAEARSAADPGSSGVQSLRSSLSYVAAVIKKKSQVNPKEIAIRNKIEQKILRTEWSRKIFERITQVQKEYLSEMLRNIQDTQLIHNRTQETLKQISEILNSSIVEGKELLDAVQKEVPVMVVTNHFGAYKLTGINPLLDLGVSIEGYDFIYPYPMYFAAISPIAQILNKNLYYVSEDFPLVFGEIHTKAGFIHVPSAIDGRNQGGRTVIIEQQIKDAMVQHPNFVIVNFPEGGTSGKYSGLGPYDLDQFKTGGYVVASHLGMIVIPVAQYFDKDEGYKLKVFAPYIPPVTSKEMYEEYANRDRLAIQSWLDQRKDF